MADRPFYSQALAEARETGLRYVRSIREEAAMTPAETAREIAAAIWAYQEAPPAPQSDWDADVIAIIQRRLAAAQSTARAGGVVQGAAEMRDNAEEAVMHLHYSGEDAEPAYNWAIEQASDAIRALPLPAPAASQWRDDVATPKWTVLYNIPGEWVGTGWEFFNAEADAAKCFARHRAAGNVPTKRPFYRAVDVLHLGAAHQYHMQPLPLPPATPEEM